MWPKNKLITSCIYLDIISGFGQNFRCDVSRCSADGVEGFWHQLSQSEITQFQRFPGLTTFKLVELNHLKNNSGWNKDREGDCNKSLTDRLPASFRAWCLCVQSFCRVGTGGPMWGRTPFDGTPARSTSCPQRSHQTGRHLQKRRILFLIKNIARHLEFG